MKASDFFSSKYLKAKDLDGPKVVTVTEVRVETMGNSSETKPVVYFKGMWKALVLNKTNCEVLEDIAGTEEMSDWPGVKAEIFPTTVEVNGQQKDCIRVRSPDQAELPTRRPVKATELSDMDDEIPF